MLSEDNVLSDRVRPATGLRAILDNPTGLREPGTPEGLSAEPLTPLPKAGDPYKAHARPENKMLPTLHVLLSNASVRGFTYTNLDSIDLVPTAEPGEGPVIVLRFAGMMATEITLRGRKLDMLHMLLGYHRIAWVRELPPKRDFLAVDEPVITRITIRPVEGFPPSD